MSKKGYDDDYTRQGRKRRRRHQAPVLEGVLADLAAELPAGGVVLRARARAVAIAQPPPPNAHEVLIARIPRMPDG